MQGPPSASPAVAGSHAASRTTQDSPNIPRLQSSTPRRQTLTRTTSQELDGGNAANVALAVLFQRAGRASKESPPYPDTSDTPREQRALPQRVTPRKQSTACADRQSVERVTPRKQSMACADRQSVERTTPRGSPTRSAFRAAGATVILSHRMGGASPRVAGASPRVVPEHDTSAGAEPRSKHAVANAVGGQRDARRPTLARGHSKIGTPRASLEQAVNGTGQNEAAGSRHPAVCSRGLSDENSVMGGDVLLARDSSVRYSVL